MQKSTLILALFSKQGNNKPCVRGPPLCARVSGAWVKNEFMKNHVKITKSQPTTMGEMGQTVKTWSGIDKNEFWGRKKFFEKKFF